MASLRMRLDHRWSQRRMSDYVDGALSVRQRDRLDRHADRCPECGPLRRALLWLTAELRDLRRRPQRPVGGEVVRRLRAADPDGEASAAQAPRRDRAAGHERRQ